MIRDDTIVALSTPPGRGGIGIVRLSGERAVEIAAGLIRVPSPLETQRATLGEFRDPVCGRLLDQVVVTCFRRPHSYTGEDVVELASHGAPVILARLVECAMDRGARAADPGEFTLRAFLNGRIDLTQAEAIRDLIESQTLYQARVAAEQMEGAVSRRLAPHKKSLLDLVARLEAGIDFAEDDVPVSGWQEIIAAIDSVRTDLGKLVEGYAYGRIVREGLSLAIVGRPNVGKSSLFNRLLNEDRAIVTATPGTTRDLVSESAAIDGIPLRFVDTAGIRETTDEVETIGVKKSFEAVADSNLRLLVVDASEAWTAEDATLLAKLRPLGALLVAANKIDLPHRLTPAELDRALSDSPAGHEVVARPQVVWTSALTGDGLAALRTRILEIAAPARNLAPDGQFITNLRHQQLIEQSLEALTRARKAAVEKVPHEMLLLDLYDALHALDILTGATAVEDVLGLIFSTFCVGK